MRKILTVMAALAAGPAVAQQAADAVQPEATTSGGFAAMSPQVAAALQAKDDGVPVQGKTWMVAAANPHAVQAGADVLSAGGTAADALVAVQTVLGLVEPQSSGLGGGAFLVWYDAASNRLTTLDGRETAPLAATPKRFLDADGEPLKFYDAVVGGLSVGVPGTPALLATAQANWGKSNWADLLQPAIALAEGGFEVSPRLATLVAGDAERLARFDSTASYFLPQGQPLQAGTRLTNVAYADTLRTLAGDPAAFYTGAIAQDIVDTVNAAVPAGGFLSIWISPCMRRANAPPFVHRFRATRSVAWARHPRAR